MKVLTIWQPWCSLIAVGAKPYEFRKGLPPKGYIGNRIAIHAAARPVDPKEVEQLIEVLRSSEAWLTCLHKDVALPLLERVLREPGCIPLRSILCTAVLGQPRLGPDIAEEFGGVEVVTGLLNDSDRDEHANYGWPLTSIQLVMPPVEHRGQQGWSEWNP